MPVRDIARVAVRLLTMGNNSNEHYDKAYNIKAPKRSHIKMEQNFQEHLLRLHQQVILAARAVV